jgi:FHA domain-containing protein
MGLQQFERRLERLVEGVFARAFRTGVQPVEIGRRLTREMDQHRTVGVRGVIVPNRFHVALNPGDRDNLASLGESLLRDLAELVREHARAEGYRLLGQVSVELEDDPSQPQGQFLVAGEVQEEAGGLIGSLILADGTRVKITDDPVTIGRLPDCEVPLADPNVSRRHAEVRRDGDTIVVVDLGSTNGTRVNGNGVKERRLADGYVITVGTTRLRFEAS